MGKLDKKVLKFLTARQEIDLDAGDIAIDLRCDEDTVQEALDSLKDQGLVESVERNGRMFWQVSMNPPLEEPDVFDEPEALKHTSFSRDIDSEKTVSFDLSAIKAQAQGAASPRVEKTVVPAFKEAPSKSSVDFDDDRIDKDEIDLPDAASGRPIMAISIAVVISVVVSAIIAVMVAGGSKKNVSESFLALEKSGITAQSKTDQRIDELAAQVKALSEKMARGQQPQASMSVAAPSALPAVEKRVVKAPPKQTAKVAAKRAPKPVVKATHASKKKKEKEKDKSDVPSYFNPPNENSSPAPSDAGSSSSPSSPDASPSPDAPSSAPSSSDQSAPSTGSGDNAAPAPSPDAGSGN